VTLDYLMNLDHPVAILHLFITSASSQYKPKLYITTLMLSHLIFLGRHFCLLAALSLVHTGDIYSHLSPLLPFPATIVTDPIFAENGDYSRQCGRDSTVMHIKTTLISPPKCPSLQAAWFRCHQLSQLCIFLSL